MDVMMIMLMGKITKNNAYIDSVNEDDDDHDIPLILTTAESEPLIIPKSLRNSSG